MINIVLLASALLAASGCVSLDYARVGSAQQNQVALENMISRQDYHNASLYLDKIKDPSDAEFYKSQRQRIAHLTKEFETSVAQKAVDRAELDDFIGAVTLVDQGLGKIPESKKLLELSEKLRQERSKRLAANDRYLLLGKAEYLFARLEWYEEQARMEKPSLITRWLMRRKEKALAGLYPDLLDCGQQAIKSAEYIIADKCLQMAKKINDSEKVRQLLAQINHSFTEAETVSYEECVVLLSVTKKSKPAAVLMSLFLELEMDFKQELEKGELLKAYESLAKLEKFPGKKEQLKGYRQQLDKAKESRIAKQLEEGASLYRRGKISEARWIWQKVLALDPQNQTAKEKVNRADKVLKSIQELQKVQ
ncbi:MAG: hypothetical protein KAS94_06720 [Desulfobulbaceae bacterium]|nr:hypothetical protein [Desulfobulbaceae bacterium]